MHRIAPASSGFSLRGKPAASFASLRKVLAHYEAKTSGKYASTSLAARYLYQLSREVRGIAGELERQRAGDRRRIAYLEALVAEWEEAFGRPEELPLDAADALEGVAMTPMRLRDALAAERRSNRALEARVAELRAAHQEDLGAFEDAIDDQHAAAEARLVDERKRLAADWDGEKRALAEAHARELARAREEADAAAAARANDERAHTRELLAGHRAELGAMGEQQRGAMAAFQAQLGARRAAHEADLRAQAAELFGAHAKREGELVSAVEKLEGERATVEARCDAKWKRVLDGTVRGLNARAAADRRRAANLTRENAWLRERAVEMQRLLDAFQVANAADVIAAHRTEAAAQAAAAVAAQQAGDDF